MSGERFVWNLFYIILAIVLIVVLFRLIGVVI